MSAIWMPRGYVFITDRLKDMINASGFKIYPRNIEEVMLTHPAVLECAVVGVPDPYRGETVKALPRPEAGPEPDRRGDDRNSSPTSCRPSKCRSRSNSAPACPRPPSARSPRRTSSKKELPHEERRHRRLCPLALPFRDQGRAHPGAARRHAGGRDPGPAAEDGRAGRGYRGSDRRLRHARGRAGAERRPARSGCWRACRSRVAGTTVNRFCGSSMQAIHMAAGAIQLGAGEAFICAAASNP